MKKSVKFEGYMIEKFLLEKIPNISKEDKEKFSLECKTYGKEQKDKKNLYCVSLTIKMFTDKSKIELTMNGYFEFQKDFDENLKDEFLNISAPAILYPYVRTFISNVTSFDIDNTVILPIVNFANIEKNY